MARHTYEYDVDLRSDSAAARVVRMAGSNRRILEIGAGPGSITRHLIQSNNCDVVAVENDRTAIEKLREFCPKIYSLDLNDPTWVEKLNGEEKFDVVIAADVLEHLYDPPRVLSAMKTLLRQNGDIILSLPHVSHSAVVACLLNENFDYRDWGLLDRTHIRFFGLKNINELYLRAGLSIVEAEFVVKTPDQTEFKDTWTSLPAEVRRAIETNKFGHIYQVVSRAKGSDVAERSIDLTEMLVPRAAAMSQGKIASYARRLVRDSLSSATKSKIRKVASIFGLRL